MQIFEETGFDARDFINEEDSLSLTLREQQVRHFVIANVPEDTVFAPKTRKEISVRSLAHDDRGGCLSLTELVARSRKSSGNT